MPAQAAVALGLLVLGGLAVASQPSAAERRRIERARGIRSAADQRLLRDLVGIAEDRRVKLATRQTAWRLATWFERLWLSGLSGSRWPAGLRFPIHGNWCGPGHGGGPCVDVIDRACRRHDLAYEHADDVEDGRV